MLRASRDEALHRRPDRARQPPRARARRSTTRSPRPTRRAPLVLALFDLDGFKHYNDTFGHPAGDALLVRLGRQPRRATCDGRGDAFRMGGDEFCALFRPAPRRATPIVHGAGAGAVRARRGLLDRLLLRRDRAARRGGRRRGGAAHRRPAHVRAASTPAASSAGRQSKDVLLRALAERDPGLGDAPHERRRRSPSATAARARARRRARSSTSATPPSCTTSARSRSPTRSSASPGPLTDEEWGFIRRHTVIGERIIAAAPGAAPASATLVRSSHERWDGAGYPDAPRRPTQIPLGARIVAVADAFDAMIAGRPYRAPRTGERGARRAPPLRRHAVRPGCGRCLVRRVHASRARGGLETARHRDRQRSLDHVA